MEPSRTDLALSAAQCNTPPVVRAGAPAGLPDGRAVIKITGTSHRGRLDVVPPRQGSEPVSGIRMKTHEDGCD
jgi:hypothetical protein